MSKRNKMWKRLMSMVLALIMICGSMQMVFAEKTAEARAGNVNYVSNQGDLVEAPFVHLPMGAVEAQDWLYNQLLLQKNGLTGAIQDNYSLYGPNNGWRGGTGDTWEKGPYYLRGLVSLAWVLDDPELQEMAMEWIDFILEPYEEGGSVRANGFFGPRHDGENADWWPRMVILQTLRDYYEATELLGEPDERVMDLFEGYFRYQLGKLPGYPLYEWGKARGGDNLDVVLWYYNRVYDPSNPSNSEWLFDLCEILIEQTGPWYTGNSWTESFTNTTVREHVVNTTQAMKTPAVIYQITGNDEDKNALREGLFNVSLDHGRVDHLANSDESARENLPYRGAELCSIVESIKSNEIAMRIQGEGWIGDELERLAYNSLPAGYTPDWTGQNYYQAQNQVMLTHGDHDFTDDHGDDIAYGAPNGFECCFPNCHMGWPTFIQNMWMATVDNGLAVVAYGPNTVTAKVANGKTAVFNQETNYPFADTIGITYEGETASFQLKLRVPEWCDAPVFKVNNEVLTLDIVDGYVTIDRTFTAGDVVEIQFPMEVRTSTWYNNAIAVEWGALIFSVKIEEDWRVTYTNDFRMGKYQVYDQFVTREVFPASKWNYGLVLNEEDIASSFRVEVDDEIALQPFSVKTAPVRIKVVGQEIPEWQLMGNLVPEAPYSPIAPNESLQTEIELIPYGSARMRISQIPTIGTPTDTVVRELDTAFIKTQDGKKVVEYDNIIVPAADEYTMRIYYTGSGTLDMNINTKYNEEITFTGNEDYIEINNLTNIISENSFRFDFGQYNNVRFFGEGVTIDKLEIISDGKFEGPSISRIEVNETSVSLYTNIDRINGLYKVYYGKDPDNLDRVGENFKTRKAVITGLEENTIYYFKAALMVNGVMKETEIKSIKTGEPEIVPAEFYDDFSDEAASRAKWERYGDTANLTFEDGKLHVGFSTDVKAAVGSETWTDYVVQATLQADKAETTRDYGIMFRATGVTSGADGFRGYYAGLQNRDVNTANPKTQLVVGYADGSAWHYLVNGADISQYIGAEEVELKIAMYGSTICIFVNDVLERTIVDTRYNRGMAGVRSWQQIFDVHEFMVREITDDDLERMGLEREVNIDFTDDFTDSEYTRANWEFWGDPDSVTLNTDEGRMQIGYSSNIRVVTGELTWRNYAVEAEFQADEITTRDYGIMLRASDVNDGLNDDDGYMGIYIGLLNENGKSYLNIGRATPKWSSIIKTEISEYIGEGPVTLKAYAVEDAVYIYVNGQYEYTLTDNVGTYPYGKAGVRSWNQSFDVLNFSVKGITDEDLELLGINSVYAAAMDAGVEFQSVENVFASPDVQEDYYFFDDFEDASLSDELWTRYGSIERMTFEDGVFKFDGNTNVKAVAGDESWTDYVAEATIQVTRAGNDSGMMFRTTNARSGADGFDGYYFGISTTNAIFGYAANGGWNEVYKKNIALGTDPHRLKVVVKDNKIALYVDDELVARLLDNRYANGLIGLRTYNGGFTADDVLVRPITENDLVHLDDLSEVDSAFESVQITFRKNNDASSYKVQYGTDPDNLTNEVYDIRYRQYNGEKVAVSGLENGIPYYIRVVALSDGEEISYGPLVEFIPGTRVNISSEIAEVQGLIGQVKASGQNKEFLNKAIAYAETVLKDEYVNMMDVNLAKNLITIGQNLDDDTKEKADKTALKELVEKVKQLDEDDYQAGWTTLQQYLEKAEAILEDEYADQKEVDHAYNMLYLSMSLLVPADGSVNKLILEIFIEAAKDAKLTDEYLKADDEAKAEFDKALLKAETVYANTAASKTEVMEAAFELLEQIHRLGFTIIDPIDPDDKWREMLEEYYNLCLLLDISQYGDESAVNEFKAAMDNAKAALDDDESSEAVLKAAYDRLVNAVNALEKLPGGIDKSVLWDAITIARPVREAKDMYVDKGWAEFEAAYQEALRVYDDSEDQEEVNKAAADLSYALTQLRMKADKTYLNKAVKTALALDLSKYTDASVKVLELAVSEAMVLLNNDQLSEDEQALVDQALLTIQNAIDNLVKKQPGGTETDDTDEESESSTQKGTDGPKQTDGKKSPGGQDGKDGKDGKGKTVKTGDENVYMMYIVMLASAASFIGLGLHIRKKKEQ